MPSSLTPEQRALRAKVAAYTRHSKGDAKQATEPARAGFRSKFEREVDPDGTLDPAERSRRAEAAMRAHMSRLALRSSKARRKPA